MTHCSDDDLVLHYYGESADAAAHVATCASCAERARDLGAVLESIPGEVPARGEVYGREVWYRIRPHLDAPRSPWARAAGLLSSVRVRGALAAAATVALVAAGFVAGRLSLQPEPAVSLPRTAAVVDAADPGLARRVLLMTVADHLERSDRVLTDIMNAPGAGDLAAEQQWADELIAANRLYRQDALDADESSVATVLEELERVLLDIVHPPAGAPEADLDQIRSRIDSAALLFKVRVLTNELRQRDLAPETPGAGHAVIPIS